MSYLGRGLVPRGGALLSGLFRCARCGRKLQVSYGGSKTFSQRYACRGAFSERASEPHIAAKVRRSYRLRLRLRVSCTSTARPSNPLRMSGCVPSERSPKRGSTKFRRQGEANATWRTPLVKQPLRGPRHP